MTRAPGRRGLGGRYPGSSPSESGTARDFGVSLATQLAFRGRRRLKPTAALYRAAPEQSGRPATQDSTDRLVRRQPRLGVTPAPARGRPGARAARPVPPHLPAPQPSYPHDTHPTPRSYSIYTAGPRAFCLGVPALSSHRKARLTVGPRSCEPCRPPGSPKDADST